MDPTQDPSHPSAWMRPDGHRVAGNTYDQGLLPSEDIGEMFSPHFLDSNAGHMNAAGYYPAARAMHGYRPSHGKSNVYFNLFLSVLSFLKSIFKFVLFHFICNF